MRHLQLIAGAVVPHAPVLLRDLAGRETRSASDGVRAALGRIDLEGFDLICLLSPHGARTGVFRRARGTLAGFGYPDIGVDVPGGEEEAEALARNWSTALLDEPADHGIVVPLALWQEAGAGRSLPPVVTATLDETMNGSATLGAIDSFVAALAEWAGERRTLFVASANGSAGLTARAPLTEIAGAAGLEDDLLAALETDAVGVEGAALALAAGGGSCGLGPLVAFAHLLKGNPARVLAHERPVGVGYTVAFTGE